MTHYLSDPTGQYFANAETGECFVTGVGIQNWLGGMYEFWKVPELNNVVAACTQTIYTPNPQTVYTTLVIADVLLYYASRGNTAAKESAKMLFGIGMSTFKDNPELWEKEQSKLENTDVRVDFAKPKPKSKRNKKKSPKEPVKEWGYCYLFWYKELNRYKIGFSLFLDKRYMALSNTYPGEIVQINSCYCYNPNLLEQQLHRKYAEKRLSRGEFFVLDDADVAAIATIFEANRNKRIQ